MIGRLHRQPSIFFLIIGLYFFVNLLVRLALPDSLELDEAQQSLVSQWLALGYDTQPPLYNWIQTAIFSAIGPSVFALSILKNLFLFATYSFYYLAARQVTKHAGFAVIAAFSLLTLPEIVWEAQRDLTHSVALNFSVAVFFYALFRALHSGRTIFYALTGVAIGIGLLSKYNFAILGGSAFLALLATPAYRPRLWNPRLLLTAAIAVLVVLPHASWLAGNLEVATAGSLRKLSAGADPSRLHQIVSGVLSLVVAALSFVGPTLVIYAAVFRRKFVDGLSSRNDATRFIGTMLLIATLLFLSMIVFNHAASFKGRWLSPILLVLPLYICIKMELSGVDPGTALRRFLPVPVIVMMLVPPALFLRVVVAGWVGSYEKMNVPYGPFVDRLAETLPGEPGLIVTQDPHLAGNMRFQFPDAIVAAPSYSSFVPDLDQARGKPALLVWRIRKSADTDVPVKLKEVLQDMLGGAPVTVTPQILRVPYHYGVPGDVYAFGYAWIDRR